MWFKLYYTTSWYNLHSLFSAIKLQQRPPFSIFILFSKSSTNTSILHFSFSAVKLPQIPPFYILHSLQSSFHILQPFNEAFTITSILISQASTFTSIPQFSSTSFHNCLHSLQSSFYKYLHSPFSSVKLPQYLHSSILFNQASTSTSNLHSPHLFSQASTITSILQLSLIKLSQLPPFSIFFNQASKKLNKEYAISQIW